MSGVTVAAGTAAARVGVGVVVVAMEDWLQDEKASRQKRRKEERKAVCFLNIDLSPLFSIHA